MMIRRPLLSSLTVLLLTLAVPALAQERGAAGQDMLTVPEQGELVRGPGLVSPSPDAATQEEWSLVPPTTPPAQQVPASPPDTTGLALEEETSVETKPDPMARLALLPRDIQEEILKEADYSHELCTYDTMLGNFYDCSCIALEVIDRRINEGPGNPFINSLSRDDFKSCAFGPLAAGYAYRRCTDLFFLVELGEPMRENTCICASRTMAKTFQERPRASMIYIDNLFNNVVDICMEQVKSGAFKP